MKRSGIAALTAAVIAGAAITVTAGLHFQATAGKSAVTVPTAVSATLPATPQSYLGVYLPGGPDSAAKVAAFTKTTGIKPDVLTYFHESDRLEILASAGKVAKFEVEVKGDFANILKVLELDGVKPDEGNSQEFQAQLIASELGMDAEELNEMYTRVMHGDWGKTLEALQARKAEVADVAF